MMGNIPILAVFIVFITIVIIVAAIVILSRSMGGKDKGIITDDILRRLEKKDPVWNKETVLEAVRMTFEVLKKSYDSGKSQVQSDIMTINIYRDLFKNVVPNLKKLAFIERMDIKDIQIIQVITHKVENRNSFTVKLELEGELEEGQKDYIYWTFIKVNNKWLLSEIHDEAVPAGYFPQ